MAQRIVLGGGCFWCTEAVFLALNGVEAVVSGYMGGTADTANYQAVCTGTTGHVEVIEVTFSDDLALSTVLDVFFATHDPTTLNRQGNDVGTQYASVIFVTPAQVATCQQKINELKAQGLDIVTDIRPLQPFYPAEDYHQDFFNKNPSQSFCNFAIPPKLQKLRANFAHLLKP